MERMKRIALGIGLVIWASVATTFQAAALPLDQIEVVDMELVDKERVTRTTFRYTFRVTIKNNGPSLNEVKGTYTSSIDSTAVPDAELLVGMIGEGETLTPVDTVSILQNRRVRFDSSQLKWLFDGVLSEWNLPLDPGDAGKVTLEGIDSDGDTLRDDLQRYVVVNSSQHPVSVHALNDMVKLFQNSLLTGDQRDSVALTNKLSRASECLIYSVHREMGGGLDIDEATLDEAEKREDELMALTLNTEARLLAYLKYQSLVEGEFFSTAPMLPEALRNSCSFDLDAI